MHLWAAFRVNLLNREIIWGHEKSPEVIAVTMSENRFKFVSCFIKFDHKPRRADCWKTDMFAIMRELIKVMTERNAKMRYPSPMLAIDKTLYPYRGCIGFK